MNFTFYKAAAAADVAAWVAERIDGCERGFGPCVALSVGEPRIAGVVFHNWHPECGVMEMSAAADNPRWLSRPVLWAVHNYIFERACCQMAVMRVSEKNERMLRIAGAYGYRKHFIPRLRGPNEAEVICTLTDDDWLSNGFHRENEHGQIKAA